MKKVENEEKYLHDVCALFTVIRNELIRQNNNTGDIPEMLMKAVVLELSEIADILEEDKVEFVVRVLEDSKRVAELLNDGEIGS